MQITLLANGTRGDIQPLIPLGLGLQRAGYKVRVAVSQDYAEMVKSRGLEYFPVRGSMQEILTRFQNDPAARSGNILKMLPGLFREASATLDYLVEDSWQACQGSQAIVYNLGIMAAFYMAARLNIPSFLVGMQPSYPTGELASLVLDPRWK